MKSRTRVFPGVPLDSEGVLHAFFFREWRTNYVAGHAGGDNAALFRNFADIVPTDTGFAEFRAKYRIEDHLAVVHVPNWRVVREVTRDALGQVKDWSAEIVAIRRCIRMWDLVREEDTEELRKLIFWETNAKDGGLTVVLENHAEPTEARVKEPVASETTDAELMSRLSPGDVVGPARVYVERQINQRLIGGVQYQAIATLPERDLNDNPKPIGLFPIPKSFVAMVWLHLSQAIEEEKRYEKCRECAAWFELSRGKAHKDRQYCSEMCKVNAYRKRKTEALRYHLDGKKPGEIARIVGSDIETVKGWIATIKKEE